MAEALSLPASRTELVLEEIRRAILTRELLPGQQLVEMDLAQRLGVSKTPVREALKILSGSGLVTFSPYKGASVRTVDRDLAQNVFDLRLLLEPEAVERSVRGTKNPTNRFKEANRILAEAEKVGRKRDHATLSLLNRDFHRALYLHCGNPLLVSMLDDLRDRAALVSVVGWDKTHSWEDEWGQHTAILDAANAGQAADAASRLRAHITGFMDRILPVIEVGAS